MALESRETSNGFALEPERGHAVRHALLCVRDDLDDRVAQLGKRCSLGLTKRAEVLVDFIVGHTGTFKVATRAVKLAQTATHRPDLKSHQPSMDPGALSLCVDLRADARPRASRPIWTTNESEARRSEQFCFSRRERAHADPQTVRPKVVLSGHEALRYSGARSWAKPGASESARRASVTRPDRAAGARLSGRSQIARSNNATRVGVECCCGAPSHVRR